MAEEGTFQKIENSDELMYGTRKLLVCGYSAADKDQIIELLSDNDFDILPVVFVSSTMLDKKIGELLQLPHLSGVDSTAESRRAVIMSGLSHAELHRLMAAYRKSGMPSQLWATVTPTSEKWPIRVLLDELATEHEELKRLRQQQVKQQNESNR